MFFFTGYPKARGDHVYFYIEIQFIVVQEHVFKILHTWDVQIMINISLKSGNTHETLFLVVCTLYIDTILSEDKIS